MISTRLSTMIIWIVTLRAELSYEEIGHPENGCFGNQSKHAPY